MAAAAAAVVAAVTVAAAVVAAVTVAAAVVAVVTVAAAVAAAVTVAVAVEAAAVLAAVASAAVGKHHFLYHQQASSTCPQTCPHHHLFHLFRAWQPY